MWPQMTYEEWRRAQQPTGLRRGSREWRAAVKGLARMSGDRDARAECPLTAETWQYMQSFRDRGRWMHEFRHRHHPVKQRRWYLHVPASAGWTPETDRPPEPEAPPHTVH